MVLSDVTYYFLFFGTTTCLSDGVRKTAQNCMRTTKQTSRRDGALTWYSHQSQLYHHASSAIPKMYSRIPPIQMHCTTSRPSTAVVPGSAPDPSSTARHRARTAMPRIQTPTTTVRGDN